MTQKGKKRTKSDNEMSFLEHLEELRWHIVRSVLSIFVVAIVAFIYHEIVFDKIILAPKSPEFFTNRLLCQLGKIVKIDALCINSKPFEIINIRMAGQFTTHIAVSLIAGVILAFPYIFWEFWRFFKPALYSSEKKHASGAVFFSSMLFMTGVLFAYYVIVPLSVHFLGSYNVSSEVNNQINLKSYIGTVASIALAGGLVFQLPIITYFLTKVGLVSPSFLRKYRKHSIVVILALAAIITPPDIFSQILVCFPLLFLYEIGIVISKRVIAREEARLQEDWSADDIDNQ
ncbi:MAG TPA: twin-arginine translocase subunit TatC [Bacteroidales bacterium]|nr:twin-arginine translocase subunit TatC [Bacteroidales bacterium]